VSVPHCICHQQNSFPDTQRAMTHFFTNNVTSPRCSCSLAFSRSLSLSLTHTQTRTHSHTNTHTHTHTRTHICTCTHTHTHIALWGMHACTHTHKHTHTHTYTQTHTQTHTHTEKITYTHRTVRYANNMNRACQTYKCADAPIAEQTTLSTLHHAATHCNTRPHTAIRINSPRSHSSSNSTGRIVS